MSGHVATFPARIEALARVLAFVESVCAGARVGREESLRLTLVVEELFVNTVVHGHGGDSDAQVTLTLDPQSSGVYVSYEDEAPRFDPSSGSAEAPDPNDRVQGGLGLVLVRKLSRGLAYSRVENANRVTFVIETS